MKHAFLAQNHAHMLSHKALVLLLECVECGFDVLNHHGRERFVERRPEQGTRPLACMTKELEKRMHSEKSSCFHGGFWKDGFAMRCLTCWFSDNAQNLVRFHRKQLQVQVYSAYIVAFKDAFSVLQDGQTEEVDGDAEEAVSARARQWVRDEVKEQVSKVCPVSAAATCSTIPCHVANNPNHWPIQNGICNPAIGVTGSQPTACIT